MGKDYNSRKYSNKNNKKKVKIFSTDTNSVEDEVDYIRPSYWGELFTEEQKPKKKSTKDSSKKKAKEKKKTGKPKDEPVVEQKEDDYWNVVNLLSGGNINIPSTAGTLVRTLSYGLASAVKHEKVDKDTPSSDPTPLTTALTTVPTTTAAAAAANDISAPKLPARPSLTPYDNDIQGSSTMYSERPSLTPSLTPYDNGIYGESGMFSVRRSITPSEMGASDMGPSEFGRSALYSDAPSIVTTGIDNIELPAVTIPENKEVKMPAEPPISGVASKKNKKKDKKKKTDTEILTPSENNETPTPVQPTVSIVSSKKSKKKDKKINKTDTEIPIQPENIEIPTPIQPTISIVSSKKSKKKDKKINTLPDTDILEDNNLKNTIEYPKKDKHRISTIDDQIGELFNWGADKMNDGLTSKEDLQNKSPLFQTATNNDQPTQQTSPIILDPSKLTSSPDLSLPSAATRTSTNLTDKLPERKGKKSTPNQPSKTTKPAPFTTNDDSSLTSRAQIPASLDNNNKTRRESLTDNFVNFFNWNNDVENTKPKSAKKIDEFSLMSDIGINTSTNFKKPNYITPIDTELDRGESDKTAKEKSSVIGNLDNKLTKLFSWDGSKNEKANPKDLKAAPSYPGKDVSLPLRKGKSSEGSNNKREHKSDDKQDKSTSPKEEKKSKSHGKMVKIDPNDGTKPQLPPEKPEVPKLSNAEQSMMVNDDNEITIERKAKIKPEEDTLEWIGAIAQELHDTVVKEDAQPGKTKPKPKTLVRKKHRHKIHGGPTPTGNNENASMISRSGAQGRGSEDRERKHHHHHHHHHHNPQNASMLEPNKKKLIPPKAHNKKTFKVVKPAKDILDNMSRNLITTETQPHKKIKISFNKDVDNKEESIITVNDKPRLIRVVTSADQIFNDDEGVFDLSTNVSSHNEKDTIVISKNKKKKFKRKTLAELLKNNTLIDQYTWNNLTERERDILKEMWKIKREMIANEQQLLDNEEIRLQQQEDEKLLEARRIRRTKKVFKEWKDMTWGETRRYAFGIFCNVFFSHPGLLVLLALYMLLGTVTFQVIEKKNEDTIINSMMILKSNIKSNIVNYHNNMKDKQENIFLRKMVFHELNYMRSFSVNQIDKGRSEVTSNKLWDVFGTMYFCITVFTTIGYGNTTPMTNNGRTTTIIYALFGIPLFGIIVAYFSQSMKDILSYTWTSWSDLSHVMRNKCLLMADKTISEINPKPVDIPPNVVENGKKPEEKLIPPVIASVILLIYILIGTFMYTISEDWTIGESFYFIIISFLAIGFGDIVPSNKVFFVLTVLYIICGISLLTFSVRVFNAYQESLYKPKVVDEEEDDYSYEYVSDDSLMEIANDNNKIGEIL